MDKRKRNGTFEEGNNYGKGRPQIPSDLRDARKLNKTEVERVINKFLHWTIKDLADYCKDETNPVFECLIASILGKAINQGDAQRLHYILSILKLQPKPEDLGDDEKPNIHKQLVEVISQIESKNGVKDD